MKSVGKAIKLDGRGGTVRHPEFISLGDDVFFGKDFYLSVYPDERTKGLSVGNHFAAQQRVRISCVEKVEIGNNVLFGGNILVTDNNHGMDPRDPMGYSEQKPISDPVVIEDGVWIGEQCIILPGAKIGAHSIIGAGSVVNGEIPPYTIAVGSPAKPVKRWNEEGGCWERIQR